MLLLQCFRKWFFEKNRHKIVYPNLDSAFRPVIHSVSLSIPKPLKDGLNCIVEDIECDHDSFDDICPRDTGYIFVNIYSRRIKLFD